MKYEDAECIVIAGAYDIASQATGKYQTEFGKNPTFDRIYEEAYEALWNVLIPHFKAGHIPID